MKLFSHLFLFTVLFAGCHNIYIDESYKSVNRKRVHYSSAVKEIKIFLDSYNDSLKVKIHEKYHKDFYFSLNHSFNTDIIFSKDSVSLIYIEKKDFSENLYSVYYTEKESQIFIQELKSNIKIANYTPEFYPWYAPPDDGPFFVSGGNYIGSPYIFNINRNSFLAYFSYSVKLIRVCL